MKATLISFSHATALPPTRGSSSPPHTILRLLHAILRHTLFLWWSHHPLHNDSADGECALHLLPHPLLRSAGGAPCFGAALQPSCWYSILRYCIAVVYMCRCGTVQKSTLTKSQVGHQLASNLVLMFALLCIKYIVHIGVYSIIVSICLEIYRMTIWTTRLD